MAGVPRGLLTWGPARSTLPYMESEETFPKRPDDPLAALARQDLDPLSVAELAARIAVLEGEIARTRAHADRAGSHRASADALFRR
jgi:uncharacterized small protein (DUF1192 family)